jgi:monoterpene epsilon-lactone hydrolase
VRAGAVAFIPDYWLAPEHVFQEAVTDVQSCYDGLIERGFARIVVVGDSAGGTLALVMSRLVTERKPAKGAFPVDAVALSPVTDLTLSGQTWKTRAVADPYFIESQARELVRSYLNGADPTDPQAFPLFGDLIGLPPIRVHVGDDEVLLDDALRYVARAVDAGVYARVDVWQGMPHGFVSGVGTLAAADQALAAIGAFLARATGRQHWLTCLESPGCGGSFRRLMTRAHKSPSVPGSTRLRKGEMARIYARQRSKDRAWETKLQLEHIGS